MKEKLLSLLDWIYKKKCYFCGKSKESVKMCSKCYDKLIMFPANPHKIINGVNVFCAGSYSKELQKLIRGLKYHKQKDLAFYQAKFMFNYWKNLNYNQDFQVVPVPLHENRLKKRKYNHMELVAQEFCNLTGYEPNFNLIKRIKDTKPQYKLTRLQRAENLKNAFEVVKSNFIPGKKILILDDICTTGSTFEEIIDVLKKQNIYDIICFATTTPF